MQTLQAQVPTLRRINTECIQQDWRKNFSIKYQINTSNTLPQYRSGNSQFVSEPTYYREYFDPAQGYAPVRTIYGDTNDSTTSQPTTTYEGRFTTHKTSAIYTKTITQAGLTVDLPSPDSGIGADAITPRDQANLQQVNLFICKFII